MTETRPLVLIVDDQPVNLNVLAGALDNAFAVQMSTNGPEALALARRPPYPEVILLNVMMPGMDGYEVCAALKADPLTADIPVIFITAKTDAESETAALRAGAVDFIHKPINSEVVRTRVHLHHELARHRHQLEDLVEARTRELAQARDAAESADRAKTALLGNVSHEMLTPLNQITGMSYVVGREVPPGRGQRAVATIDQAARELLRMVQCLLDLASLESMALCLDHQAFAVREMLEQALADYREPAQAKGLSLALVVEPTVPERMLGDAARLRQILGQLLDNAVKFSSSGGIRLTVVAGEQTRTTRRLYFRVEDTGIGMTPEVAAGLFQHFRQGDDSLTRAYPGLGLGLALCQRLVALMGGEIDLTSTQGQGTTASVWVPLGTIDAAATIEG